MAILLKIVSDLVSSVEIMQVRVQNKGKSVWKSRYVGDVSPNYTADVPLEAWIESYEMAMELLEVSDAVCAKYFRMMLDMTARTWLKGLPANSIRSWAELKARFIQNFKDTCKQPMSIVDLDACAQEEGELTTHWVHRVKALLHSSDNINAGPAVLMLEKKMPFLPLKQKLGRLKRHCNDMGGAEGSSD